MSVCVCVVTVSIARQHFENSSPRALRDGPYRFLCIPMTDQNELLLHFLLDAEFVCIQKHKMHARRWSVARCPSPCMHSGTSEAIARGSVCSECWPSCHSYDRAPGLTILRSTIGSCQTNVEWCWAEPWRDRPDRRFQSLGKGATHDLRARLWPINA